LAAKPSLIVTMTIEIENLLDSNWVNELLKEEEATFLEKCKSLEIELKEPIYQLLPNEYGQLLHLFYRLDIKESNFKDCLQISINLRVVAECLIGQIMTKLSEKRKFRLNLDR